MESHSVMSRSSQVFASGFSRGLVRTFKGIHLNSLTNPSSLDVYISPASRKVLPCGSRAYGTKSRPHHRRHASQLEFNLTPSITPSFTTASLIQEKSLLVSRLNGTWKKKKKNIPTHFHNMQNEMGRAPEDAAPHQIQPVWTRCSSFSGELVHTRTLIAHGVSQPFKILMNWQFARLLFFFFMHLLYM